MGDLTIRVKRASLAGSLFAAHILAALLRRGPFFSRDPLLLVNNSVTFATDGLVGVRTPDELDLLGIHGPAGEGSLLAAINADSRQFGDYFCHWHQVEDIPKGLPLKGAVQSCDYDHDAGISQLL